MEQRMYVVHKGMESSWWYRGRARAVLACAAHAGMQRAPTALDYGAGFGGMEEVCVQLADAADAYEPNEQARAFAATRGYRKTFSDENSALSEQYDRLCLFDVLEHIKDDGDFLIRAKHTIGSSGRLVLTVPAFMTLWSEHDVANHHYRRYTKTSLSKLLKENGYIVEYASYWNCTLLIPAAIMRLLGKSGAEGLTPPSLVNGILSILVAAEALFLRYIPLPFGLSIVIVARAAA